MAISNFIKRLRDIMRNDAGINGDAQRIEQISWALFLKVYDKKEQDWIFDDDSYQSIIPEGCRWADWAYDDHSGCAMTGDTLLNFVNNTLFPTLKNLPVDANTPIKKAIVKTVFDDAHQYMKDGTLLRQIINVIDELNLDDYEESHAFGAIYENILKELQSAGDAGEFYTPRAVTDFMSMMIDPQIGEKMADFACGTGGFITSWLKYLEPKIKTSKDREFFNESIYGVEKKQFPYMLCITNMLLHDIDMPEIVHGNSLTKDVLDYSEKDKFDVILMNPPYGGNEKKDVQNHFPDDLAGSETADLFMAVIMYRLRKNGRAAVVLPDTFLFGKENNKVNLKKKLLKDFNLHTVIRLPGSVFAPYTPLRTNLLFFDNNGPTKEVWFYRLDMPEGYKHFSKTKPMELNHFQPAIEWWNKRKEITIDGFPKSKKYSIDQLEKERGFDIDLCGFPHSEEQILDPLDLINEYEKERSSLNASIDRVLAQICNGLRGGLPTSEEQEQSVTKESIMPLVDEHETVWGRLESLNQRFPVELELSIIQAALSGKLVHQNISEGTGLDVLTLSQKQKMLASQKGRVKKHKDLPAVKQEEELFDIPETWCWTRIGELFQHNTGKALNSSDAQGKPYTYITTSNVYWNHFEINKLKEMLFTDEELEKCTVRKGDLLVLEGGDFGRTAIWPYDFETRIQNHIHRLRPYTPLCIEYFYYLFFLYKNAGLLRGKGIGIQGLSANVLDNLAVPLPPLEEQKRIVKRINELLPLCRQPAKERKDD